MKTNWQDPGSGEINSPAISGLQEAVGKIEDAIGLQTVAEVGVPLTEVYIEADDRYRIYQAAVGKRNWVADPAPVIKKNGVAIATGFTIDYGGGAIILDAAALGTDVFIADFTRTNDVHSITPASIGAESKADADAHKAETAVLIPQAGSTANAIVLSLTVGQNKQFTFKAAADNIGNMTINTLPFLKLDGSQIPAGGIKNGKVYDFYYDSVSGGRFFLLARASGTATIDKVLAGETFSNDNDSGLVGTRDESQLIPANVRKGVTIADVTGDKLEFGATDKIPSSRLLPVGRNTPVTITLAATDRIDFLQVLENGNIVACLNTNGTSGWCAKYYSAAGALLKTYNSAARLAAATVDVTGTYMYVCTMASPGTVKKIDLSNYSEVQTRALPSGWYTDMVFKNGLLYATCYGRKTYIVNATTLEETTSATHALAGHTLSFPSDGYIYTGVTGSNNIGNAIYKLHPTTLATLATATITATANFSVNISKDGSMWMCQYTDGGNRYFIVKNMAGTMLLSKSFSIQPTDTVGGWFDDYGRPVLFLAGSATTGVEAWFGQFDNIAYCNTFETVAMAIAKLTYTSKYYIYGANGNFIKVGSYEQEIAA
jgi:hypothetical protein